MGLALCSAELEIVVVFMRICLLSRKLISSRNASPMSKERSRQCLSKSIADGNFKVCVTHARSNGVENVF